MRIGSGGGPGSVQRIAELIGQVFDAAVYNGESVDKLEDHLDARQIDTQVSLEAHYRPEPADLRGLIAFNVARVDGPHQTQGFIPDEYLG
jgi:hypothetical protein